MAQPYTYTPSLPPHVDVLGHPISPFTTSSLTTNLICRVLLGLIANAVSIVPLQLLYKNGEFAAVVFIANLLVVNSRNVINSLIWRNDDVSSWFPGYGICDIDAYVTRVNISLFATCLLAVMRNLAIQVGSLRANPLTQREKRRRNLIQGLIMFPIPLIQLGFVYPLAAQRYWIGPLVGCTWVPTASWPYIILLIFPPMIIALATTVYAILIYIRYREVVKTTASVLSSNRTALMRTQRTKRRLYLMVISILIPFLPLTIALGIGNLLLMGPIRPFDFHLIHAGTKNRPWDTISYLTSEQVSVYYMNNCYVPIMTALPVFIFFGMTKDAMNQYRKMLLLLGLGKLFPVLNEEYDPDRSGYSNPSNGLSTTVRPSEFHSKGSSFSALKQLGSIASSSTISTSQRGPEPMSLNFLSSTDPQDGTETHLPVPTASRLQLRSISIATAASPPTFTTPQYDSPASSPPPPVQSPFLFRTRLNLPIIPFKWPFASKSKAPLHEHAANTPLQPLHPARSGDPARRSEDILNQNQGSNSFIGIAIEHSPQQ